MRPTTKTSAKKTPPLPTILPTLLVMALFLALIGLFWRFAVDDAYITFRSTDTWHAVWALCSPPASEMKACQLLANARHGRCAGVAVAAIAGCQRDLVPDFPSNLGIHDSPVLQANYEYALRLTHPGDRIRPGYYLLVFTRK